MKEQVELGWNEFFAANYKPTDDTHSVGRVTEEMRDRFRVQRGEEHLEAMLAGRMRHHATGRGELPAVGDWVVMRQATPNAHAVIEEVLPRKSKISRRSAGQQHQEQIVAANVDIAFIVSSLNEDFNIRRLERYLILVWESGATPVILLSKADLCDDPSAQLEEIAQIAYGVPTHCVSAHAEQGLDALQPYLTPGQTIVFIGSSGVGKSTLLNKLAGEQLQKVQEVREIASKGKHTTTSRTLYQIAQGALVIDTPGMRELQLWDNTESLERAFEDVQELLTQCRFRNCQHNNEPGCAIRAAIDDGSLEEKRFESYCKLIREAEYQAQKQSQSEEMTAKKRWQQKSKKRKFQQLIKDARLKPKVQAAKQR